MKKSFMNNLKNFVDTNVRHRIERVTYNSGGISNSIEPLNDDLSLIEHHFDDIQLFCVDAEKKISNMLQSIQLSSTTPSNLGVYTQNVQAGLSNIAQQAVNITSSASSIGGFNNSATNDNHSKNSHHRESKSNITPNQNSPNAQQYRSSESLSKVGRITQPDQNHSIEHQLANDVLQRFKKLPIVGLYKFLDKSSKNLMQDSLLAITLTHYAQLQAHLTNLFLTYEQMIDSQCLKTIQHMLEIDIPNVLKLKKSSLKAHNDLESLRSKFNGASQKQQQQQQQQQQQHASASGHFTNTSYLISQNSIQQGNKLEQLKNELDEAVTKFEQARDAYEVELFGFVCREPELVNLMKKFYQLESEYHQKVSSAIQSSSPTLNDTLARTPRKFAFGTALEEHLRSTGRTISPVIELCTHFLHLRALKEEGLFRIPGSSIKIKKLKNGINAWFVTLMNLDELESGQVGHNCIVALHDLFKNAIGQCPPSQQSDFSDGLPKSSLASIGSTLNPTGTSALHGNDNQSENNNDDYILDVHSIAGLLKLYLRELPEPLFTHALYDDWITCISSEPDSTDRRIENLTKVMERLPRANYENLKHLIKFLNHLASFQELNKMTSTNLAIAMAPSLIWSKPLDQRELQPSSSVSSSDDAQSLNLQMCSFGVSASQHATIIEALINNADRLFPEPTDYTLPEFTNLTLKSTRVPKITNARSTLGRSVKSTSPTGLSTASSSSFSSNTSNSTASSAAKRGHNRKGGSMEGLLGGPQDIKNVLQHNMSTRSTGRPVSVQIRRDDYSTLVRQTQKTHPMTNPVPPVKPPVPNARSYPKSTAIPPLQSSHKSRAPPVPPPTSIRHQQERLKASSSSTQDSNMPRPVSLRGTGTISATSSGQSGTSQATVTSSAAARPSVPPPERPATSALISQPAKTSSITDRQCKSVDDSDTKSSHSLTSSGNLRADFEEISANEVEEIDLSTQSNSPVISLDSFSGDSSFDDDNDNTSLDRSWTRCFKTGKQTDEQQEEDQSRSGTLKMNVRDLPSDQDAQPSVPNKYGIKSVNADRAQEQQSNGLTTSDEPSSDHKPPPTKPPRSASPKITQSTPL